MGSPEVTGFGGPPASRVSLNSTLQAAGPPTSASAEDRTAWGRQGRGQQSETRSIDREAQGTAACRCAARRPRSSHGRLEAPPERQKRPTAPGPSSLPRTQAFELKEPRRPCLEVLGHPTLQSLASVKTSHLEATGKCE